VNHLKPKDYQVMELQINGQSYSITAPEDERLIWVLRDELGLTGSKHGCQIGICGACTVHVDGQVVRACITPVGAVVGAEIRTIEGLATTDVNGQDVLHPVQQAFLETQTPQCSWCMSGQMMTAAAFLANNPQPTPEEINQAMNNNYCRCATYVRIREAVARAAEILKEES
jgi:isoquinoline 1-oxidoreductase subunit alpha